MEKLDKRDKKILYHLSNNSRQGFSKIAKKVNLSKNAVNYRVERLQKQGIIKKFLPNINMGVLGVTTYDLLIKLKSKPEEEQKILNYLKNHDNTVWMVKLSGEWDILLEVVVKDLDDFSQTLSQIFEKLGNKIDKYETHIDMETYKVIPLIEDFFEELELPKQKTKRQEGYLKLDEKDKKILYELSQDGLIQQYKIAEKINTSPDSVAYRMKRLEKQGIIITHVPSIDMKTLGYSDYLLILDLRNPKKEEITKLKQYIINNKNITYAFRGATRFEVILFITVKDTKNFDLMLKEIKNKFYNIIQNQKFMLITEDLQFTLFPKAMLNY
ncbi:MAG: winged helix-turn-helix transcriptional regulator [archaeon]